MEKVSFLSQHFLPAKWHNRLLDYRLDISGEDRKRFSDMKTSLKNDLVNRTCTLSSVLGVYEEQSKLLFGSDLYREFQAQMITMSRDSRLSSLADEVEILGHQFFAENSANFDLPNGSLENFICTRNKKSQEAVLNSFYPEERDAAKKYLAMHPRFYSIAKKNFWLMALLHIKPQEQTHEKRPFYMEGGALRIKIQGEDRAYKVCDWTEIEDEIGKSLSYRLLQRGLAKGKNDNFLNMEPFKEVDSKGRCVFQSITSLLRESSFSNPINVSMGNTGHVFSQIIIPKEEGEMSDVYSWGLFMKNWTDLGKEGPLATFAGCIKSPDDHWTKIIDPDSRKGYMAIVKEYELTDDKPHSVSLCAYANSEDMNGLILAMKKRNLVGFNKIVERLKTVKNDLSAPPRLISKEDKAKLLVTLVDDHFRKGRDFQATEGNCSVENQWQERFIINLLDAVYYTGEPVKVYEYQLAQSEVKIGIIDRISNFFIKTLIFIGGLYPGSGAGKAHSSAPGEPIMSRADVLKIARGDRANTTFASIESPTHIPKISFVNRCKMAFLRFINYLRGTELPSH